MPRYHDIWDSTQAKQIRQKFTAPEETQADNEEAAFLLRQAARQVVDTRLSELHAALLADTITQSQIREMLRLERG